MQAWQSVAVMLDSRIRDTDDKITFFSIASYCLIYPKQLVVTNILCSDDDQFIL